MRFLLSSALVLTSPLSARSRRRVKYCFATPAAVLRAEFLHDRVERHLGTVDHPHQDVVLQREDRPQGAVVVEADGSRLEILVVRIVHEPLPAPWQRAAIAYEVRTQEEMAKPRLLPLLQVAEVVVRRRRHYAEDDVVGILDALAARRMDVVAVDVGHEFRVGPYLAHLGRDAVPEVEVAVRLVVVEVLARQVGVELQASFAEAVSGRTVVRADVQVGRRAGSLPVADDPVHRRLVREAQLHHPRMLVGQAARAVRIQAEVFGVFFQVAPLPVAERVPVLERPLLRIAHPVAVLGRHAAYERRHEIVDAVLPPVLGQLGLPSRLEDYVLLLRPDPAHSKRVLEELVDREKASRKRKPP